MLWRVHAILAFKEHDEALDFFHDCAVALLKAATINYDQPNEEKSYALIEECHHDETPPNPCITLEVIESPEG